MRQLSSAICMGIVSLAFAQTTSPEQLMQAAKNLNSAADSAQAMLDSNLALADSVAAEASALDSLATDSMMFQPVVIRDLDEILSSLPDTMPQLPYNPIVGPWVFSGYRSQKDRYFNDVVDGDNL
ncbi:MAG: hypothetical protein K2H22_01395, partial [Muribaculaceae bacterium]|nr:hypothetical protein [Muribaculaceae bacterium]